MNKGFVVKMMQAKQLEYQALKEIMPESVANRVARLETEFCEIAKELVMSSMCGGGEAKTQTTTSGKTKTRKVTIE